MNAVPPHENRYRSRWAPAAGALLFSVLGAALCASAQPAHAETGRAVPRTQPGSSGPAAASLAAGAADRPDFKKGSDYLVAPAQLTDGHYYAPFGGGFADFGLTIDGAYALAAARTDDAALAKIIDFLDQRKTDGTGRSIDDWTGIGTPYASGGSIAKEALLAEIVGKDPRSFGGHDLIAALDKAVCVRAGTGADTACAAPGSYTYAPSVFSQSLGIMAQLRVGDTANAAGPVAYLEGLQNDNGSWPSLIPSTNDSDVDSTAMAVMALALTPDGTHSPAVTKGIAWIAGQQEKDGGFPGAAGDSTNSAALAVQGLSLDAGSYTAQIAKALKFLAGQQNGDGGFDVAADGQPGSDVRASTQALGGATGISFGTLTTGNAGSPSPTPSSGSGSSPSPSSPATSGASPSSTATAGTTALPSISTVPDEPTGSGGPEVSDASTASAPPPGTGGTTPPNDGQLASTGSDMSEETLVAGALLMLGAASVAVARRGRERHPEHR
ncbi:terpene cyclase/mutase family protein [Streptomyces sp. J2-1]|uniref:prenyltransferase/squalene oxidase repeat-containing protein n=1 Tax=Streptomyces corallincola TaxID=2851888 RepID=UPI001C380530|nr:terpene cyclase/mutase family protein [Streptomyces corallincola]